MNLKEEVKELATDNPMMWGTKLDYTEEIPTQYAGKSFFQIDLDDLEEFFKLSNIEKFKMAYYIERISGKRSGRTGLILGIVLGIIIGIILGHFLTF